MPTSALVNGKIKSSDVEGMQIKVLLALMIISLLACSRKPQEPNSDAFEPGKKLSEMKDDKIEEASGLATSKRNPGYLWTHNDSFNDANVFLVDQDLKIKLTCRLAGVVNRDWEDITVGPGPEEGKSYIYLGDIGDNLAQYQIKLIYRFEEPVFTPGVEQITITRFDTIAFQLPGERKDTETLMINPLSKDLYIVSKREEPVHVYELKYPYSVHDTLTAQDIATVPITLTVAGDFSADGKEILLKNYKNVYYWKNDSTRSLTEVLKDKPLVVTYQEEPQGEAITWAEDGSGFYTLSEKKKGKKSYLYFYPRRR
jgi:hypothetical protein